MQMRKPSPLSLGLAGCVLAFLFVNSLNEGATDLGGLELMSGDHLADSQIDSIQDSDVRRIVVLGPDEQVPMSESPAVTASSQVLGGRLSIRVFADRGKRPVSGVPVRVLLRSVPSSDANLLEPRVGTSDSRGMVSFDLPCHYSLSIEVPCPGWYSRTSLPEWAIGAKGIAALRPGETRNVDLTLDGLGSTAIFWGKVISAESGENLDRALAEVVTQFASTRLIASGVKYLLGEGNQTYKMGLFRAEAPWWPEWTILVQCEGYSPQLLVPEHTGFTHQEPRVVAMKREATITGIVEGLPARPDFIKAVIEIPIADVVRITSDVKSAATGMLQWEVHVSPSGEFRIAELPAGLNLIVRLVDSSSRVIGSSQRLALSVGETRRVTLTLN